MCGMDQGMRCEVQGAREGGHCERVRKAFWEVWMGGHGGGLILILGPAAHNNQSVRKVLVAGTG